LSPTQAFELVRLSINALLLTGTLFPASQVSRCQPPHGEARNTSISALVTIGCGFGPPSFDESIGLARAIVSLNIVSLNIVSSNIVSMDWITERMSIIYSITRLRVYSALVYHHYFCLAITNSPSPDPGCSQTQ